MLRYRRRLLLVLIDALLINLAFLASFYIRFDYRMPAQYLPLYHQSFLIVTAVCVLTLVAFRQYSRIWRYANLQDIVYLVTVLSVGSGLSTLSLYLLHINLPRSIYALSWLLTVLMVAGSRIWYRIMVGVNSHPPKPDTIANVLIIGAGSAGQLLIQEMLRHPELGKRPVAILDDDLSKYRRSIEGVRVAGPVADLPRVVREQAIAEAIFAIPSAPRGLLKQVVADCSEAKVKVRTLPGIYELIDGKVTVKQVRDIEINDLLGREPVQVNLRELSSYIQGRRILVTGGGGSIGSELCRQVAKLGPAQLILFDIYENTVYEIQQELRRRHPGLDIVCVLADMRDEKRVHTVFNRYRPEVVFHAAAHKHVPLMEDNPQEALLNNVYGTLNLVKYAARHSVKKFVLISTDKAVNPTSIMGSTKRICEMVIQAFDRYSSTEFVAVRFGNVLGSNGSVIPLFRRQIEEGGPVTVTHAEMTRYFMTIPEAVQLVLQAGALARGGEIFVLDMGEPVKIVNLARDLIRLSGYEPDVDIEIKVTGLRPGEKLFEELLLSDAKYQSTQHTKILVETPNGTDFDRLLLVLDKYKNQINDMESHEVKDLIKTIVPEYVIPWDDTREEVAATKVN